MQLLVTTNDSDAARRKPSPSPGTACRRSRSIPCWFSTAAAAWPTRAGDVKKIEALRSASQLYADLLRFDPITGTGDKLGFVKYNATSSDYMPLGLMDGALRSAIQSNFMSAGAIADPTRIQPSGRTGIGGAMQRGAAMLAGSGSDRNIAMVLLTDGAENEAPYHW